MAHEHEGGHSVVILLFVCLCRAVRPDTVGSRACAEFKG
jgi:hypothetical protein